jgi:predicted unusual protein kinase regulating ubiquinone biosynthesis (AarF/ABC1/UbiB family)
VLLRNARYRKIVVFFASLTLNILFWDIGLRQIGLGALGARSREARYLRFAERFRALAIRLGGVLIKIGQFLSSRVDVLPRYITQELAGLQDEVPAVDFAQVQQVLTNELGDRLGQALIAVDERPLAAASLGQTYRARLADGQGVVVKVQRPGIEDLVEVDLAALRTVAQWLKRYGPIRRRANVEALLAEFSEVLRRELDYTAELAHAERFARMFAEDPGVRIPRVHPELSTARVLVLEDVGYIKITDYDQLTALGIDRGQVAQRLFETYLRQIFDHSFFHADPHPGNLFVQPPGEDAGWRLVFIDFGMVGEITPQVRDALREAAIAIGTRDPRRLIGAFQAMGAILPSADLERIIEAQQAVFDEYWGKSMEELVRIDPREAERFIRQFQDLLFELPFQVPENLIYLGRTVSILSGMCTGLDPRFNLFLAITPFAQQLLSEQSAGRNLEFWVGELFRQLQRLAALPARVDNALARIEKGEFSVTVTQTQAQQKTARSMSIAVSRLANTLVALGLLATGTVLYLNQQPTLGLGSWGLAAVVWLRSELTNP